MCHSAAAIVRPSGDHELASLRIVAVGIAAGLVGILSFATAHALLIVPIWTRLLAGLPFAVLAGIAIAWALDETAMTCGPLTGVKAAGCGGALWLTLAPATALENGLRLAGRRIPESLGVVAAVALALLSGAYAGWLLTRHRSGALAWAGATLGLTLAMGGPIPVVNAARAAWLYASFLPIAAGAAMAVVACQRFKCQQK